MEQMDTEASGGQRQRFIEAACQIGADEAAFKAKLAQVARQKVKDVPEEPKGEQ